MSYPKSRTLYSGSFGHHRGLVPISTGWAYAATPLTFNWLTRTVSSVKTPGFRTINRKDLPINPHSYDIFQRDDEQMRGFSGSTDGTYSVEYQLSGSYLWVAAGVPPSLILSNSSFSNEVRERALARLVENTRGAKVNLAQVFAERGQTVSMVSTTASRLAETYRSLRRGRPFDALKSLGLTRTPPRKSVMDRYRKEYPKRPQDAASNLWLELQYGWKPLLSDIYDSCELLAERVRTQRDWAESVGVDIHKQVRSFPVRYNTVIDGTKTIGQLVVDEEFSARYKITYTVSDSFRQSLGKTGVTDPLLLAWELLPYSFVVDWFLPVGQYLESFSAYDGLSFGKGFVQQKTKKRVFSKVQYYATFGSPSIPQGFYNERMVSADYSARGTRYDRTPLLAFPTPSFPKLQNPFTPTRLANTFALLNNAFRGR